MSNGLGAAFDMGGKTSLLLESPRGLLILNGLGMFCIDMGGKAAALLFSLLDLFSSFFGNALKGDGADFDMGGNAALLGVDDVVDVLLSSFFVATPDGFGAALDMGGKAAALLLLEVVLGFIENGFFGAALDIGGKAAATSEVFFSSDTLLSSVLIPKGFGADVDIGG